MSTTDLFVYGTLMYPELYRKLTGEEPDYTPAELRHYSVRKLNERPYPGLVRRIGGRSVGLLIRNVTAEAMERLNAYEGDEYELIEVTVKCGTEQFNASAYAIQENYLHLVMTEGWQPDWSRL